MKLKKIIAAIAAAAMSISLAVVPAMAETKTETGTVSIDSASMLYIKGYDGSVTKNGTLDIADKAKGIMTYNEATDATRRDVNVGFVKFSIPEDINLTDATLKLTSSMGQYGNQITAYAAVADLNTVIAPNQNAAVSFENITWANRPKLENPTKGVTYTVGGSNAYSSDHENDLEINLKDEKGNLIVNSGEEVVLAIYFEGANSRETFSAAEVEYTYNVNIPEGPAFTAEVVDDSFVTANGTGDYVDETATGFIAKIGSTIGDTKLTSLSLSINNENKGTQDFTTDITPNGSDVYVGIIVNQEVKADDDISITVE